MGPKHVFGEVTGLGCKWTERGGGVGGPQGTQELQLEQQKTATEEIALEEEVREENILQ